MLFSFPEYLSGSTLNNDGYFHIIFGALNIALALPVLLYSSSDYLKSAWAAIKQGGINLDVPISIGILALFLRSVYEIIGGIGAGYMDSFTGLVFFLLVGRMVQKKTYERLSFDRDYKSYLPISVTRITENGSEESLSIDKLQEGMQMLIRNHELVPADAVLISENCFIDYSFITGEEDPVKAEKGDTIYAGGKVVGASALMKTVKEVSNSYLTELWNNSVFDDSHQRRNISSLADRISPHFTLAVLGIACISAVLWWPYSSTTAITVFTSVLIIACPCALALSTPFTLGSALNIFSQNGLFIKGIEVIERLANTTSIVFDKTGTLTKANKAEVTFSGKNLSELEISLIKSVCRESVHPLSQKITASLNGAPLVSITDFQEILNNGIHASANGHAIALGSENFIQGFVPENQLQRDTNTNGASIVHVAIDRKWIGHFEIDNAYRNGIKELLSQFKNRFSTYLLSGDNESQRSEFSPYFDSGSLRFNQKPQQKLDFIKKLQQKDGNVVMVGDGLNDAGALKQSDCGIALADDVHSFTPACDAIMDGESISKLNTFIDFSQSSIGIIKASFGLSLLYNVVGLGFAVAGQLSPLVAAILMPLSSISIMIFTTTGTYLIAKKMGLQTWK
ncbi:MAG: HAD-IC family P-type ATPase [Balneolaceae bacterium]|nr:HAD-IC family P-type ATPase [Balneolaceae bacterium]